MQTNQAAPITLTLPDSAAWATQNNKYGLPLSIFDNSGSGAANTVTISGSGGQTINGAAAQLIDTNYGGYRLKPKLGGGWVVV